MRPSGVVFTPFSCLFAIGGLKEELLELFVRDAFGFGPCCVRQLERRSGFRRKLGLMVAQPSCAACYGERDEGRNKEDDGDCRESYGAVSSELFRV